MTALDDAHITVDGLRTRYREAGVGPPVLLLHGASLGSSLDSWSPIFQRLADRGHRVIAYDQPGYGLSDNPPTYSLTYLRDFLERFMVELGVPQAAIVGHSLSGAQAVRFALESAPRVSHVVVVAGGSVLPPAPGASGGGAGRGGGDPESGLEVEPSMATTRRSLEVQLFDPSLATDEAVQTRHRMSIGKNFAAFRAREALRRERGTLELGGAGDDRPAWQDGRPLWQRMPELGMLVMSLYGEQDRARAGQRARVLKARYPGLPVHILDRCKHLLHWDQSDTFVELVAPFLQK